MKNNKQLSYPIEVMLTASTVSVTLSDGRVVSNPLEIHQWLKRVYETHPELLNEVELTLFSVWWPHIDEGLDIEGMIREIPSRK